MKTSLWFVPILALVVLGSVLPGKKIPDYPRATNLNDADVFVMYQNNITKSLAAGLLRTNFSTNAYISVITTSNGLVTIINSSSNGLLTIINNTSNTLFSTSGTNIAGILASNNVRVAAGANVTVTTSSSSGLRIYTVASSSSISGLSANFDSITVTNAFNRIRSLVPSTTLVKQIDFATGPTAYYWTNMVTNITLQITNTWVGSVSNRVIDFFFTGATNTGPNYTVTFSCPDPSGLIFRWGTYSVTNGANAFAVTNNSGAGVSLTLWDTNLIEAYYSPTR